MILLLLGWHLSLLGPVTILLGAMTGSFAAVMVGVFLGALGVGISFALRKTCPSYRSDVAAQPSP
jgi:uncharacterized membrane protein YphA (DoxX/SURF4 family)